MHSQNTIVIIDQEKILVDLLIHELASSNVRVLSAQSTDEARLMLPQIHPDLVILDPHMPNAMELLTEIRSADEPIAVIALKHSNELNDRLAALGVESVVDRSQGFVALLHAIQAYLDLEPQSLAADKIQILVVDDEKDILDMLSYALEQWGYWVLTAKDGNEALQAVERHPRLALVLLDLMIPGKGGMEVLREIRARHLNIGVIMLTAISDREIAHQAIGLGAFDYIVKPVELSVLETVIGTCLSHEEYQSQSWWKRLIS